MKQYKDLPLIDDFIKKIKVDTGITIMLLEDCSKNDGKYDVPENVITFDVSKHKIYTYGKNRDVNKKLHAYFKKEGYYCIWIRCFGGHKVSFIAQTPSKNYDTYGSYL